MAKSMRKVRIGSVVRTGREKTAVVEMVWKQRHRIYGKQMRRVARFQVHDPENQCRLGDVVRIEETRPISKTKHWRLMEILQRRQVADVAPIELESDAVIVTPEAEAVEEAPAAVVQDLPSADPESEDSPVDSREESEGEPPADEAPEASADAPMEDAPAGEAPEASADALMEDAPADEADEAPDDAPEEDAPASEAADDEPADVASDDPAEAPEEDETTPEAKEDEDGQR